MEHLSFHLTNSFQAAQKKIVALRKKSQLHLLWFVPYCFLFVLLRGKRFDVVHLSDMVLLFFAWWVKVVSRNTKVVMNVHGLDLTFAEQKGLAAFVYKQYLRLFDSSKNYDLLICNSRYTEGICKRFSFFKTQVIYPGIDSQRGHILRESDRCFDSIVEDKKILLTVGRLVKRKGVQWFISEVFPKLPSSVVYVVVGPSDDSDEAEEIRRIVHERHWAERVLLLGSVSDEELKCLYKRADIFVMPNIPVEGDAEGFGIVALEAASFGLPVVASALEGIAEAIHDGENGFLVKPKDAEGFLQKISELFALDQETTVRLRERIRQFTHERYSWDRIIDQYHQAFKSIL